MSCIKKIEKAPCLGLINANVLVSSAILLERERERERETQV